MDKILNDYLEKVDKYLKPVKVTDRMDIIKEIESDMAELGEHGDFLQMRLWTDWEIPKNWRRHILEKRSQKQRESVSERLAQ